MSNNVVRVGVGVLIRDPANPNKVVQNIYDKGLLHHVLHQLRLDSNKWIVSFPSLSFSCSAICWETEKLTWRGNFGIARRSSGNVSHDYSTSGCFMVNCS